jgi:hypothetical protein
MGWRAVAEATAAKLATARAAGQPYAAVVTDDRSVTAELLYYMRGEATPVLAWRAGPRPHDHFELTRPYGAKSGEPVLLVSLKGLGPPTMIRNTAREVTDGFAVSQLIAEMNLPTGYRDTRRVTFIALSGYKGR